MSYNLTEKPFYDTGSKPTPIHQEKNETKQSENTYNPIKSCDTNRYHHSYCEKQRQNRDQNCELSKYKKIYIIDILYIINSYAYR